MPGIEQKHAELEKTIELQTFATGALVNKAPLERLNESYDKLLVGLPYDSVGELLCVRPQPEVWQKRPVWQNEKQGLRQVSRQRAIGPHAGPS